MVLGTSTKKICSIYRKSTGYPDLVRSYLGHRNVPKLGTVGGNDPVTRDRLYLGRDDACMGLFRRCAVCSMELGLFACNLQASSNGPFRGRIDREPGRISSATNRAKALK